mmetsp:Transcript_1652/g.3873  ORF Transcript_1652/g.3873 Transcript_1652/m.3873 type:complete len:81 (-) Transcript_1652:466-708(-)
MTARGDNSDISIFSTGARSTHAVRLHYIVYSEVLNIKSASASTSISLRWAKNQPAQLYFPTLLAREGLFPLYNFIYFLLF